MASAIQLHQSSGRSSECSKDRSNLLEFITLFFSSFTYRVVLFTSNFVRFSQCHFASEAPTGNKNSSAIIRRTASAARHGSEYNNSNNATGTGGTAASRTSMYFDDYVDEVVEDDGEDMSQSGDSEDNSSDDFDNMHDSALEPTKERVFVRTPNKSVAANVSVHVDVDGDHSPGPGASIQGVTSSSSSPAPAENGGSSKKEDGSNVKLEAGIVDYCVVLGERRHQHHQLLLLPLYFEYCINILLHFGFMCVLRSSSAVLSA